MNLMWPDPREGAVVRLGRRHSAATPFKFAVHAWPPMKA